MRTVPKTAYAAALLVSLWLILAASRPTPAQTTPSADTPLSARNGPSQTTDSNGDHLTQVGWMGILSMAMALVAVIVAWWLSRRDTRTQVAMSLFMKVSEDYQNYRHAFLRFYRSSGEVDFEKDLKSMETALNADCLMLGLLFDKKADGLGRALQELLAMSEIFNRSKTDLPPFDACQEEIRRWIDVIVEEMRRLWESTMTPTWQRLNPWRTHSPPAKSRRPEVKKEALP